MGNVVIHKNNFSLLRYGTSTTTLLLFDDKLKQMFDIYKEKSSLAIGFDSLDDELLMEILLTVQAKVVFNAKRNVFSIKKIPSTVGLYNVANLIM